MYLQDKFEAGYVHRYFLCRCENSKVIPEKKNR